MELNLDNLTFIYPERLFLQFSPEEREKTWKESQNQNYSNAVARWNAHLNRLCLNTFLSYLETKPDLPETPEVWPSLAELPSFWEVIEGTAIQIGKTRLVLIPSEHSHVTEFRVPREWLDIPDWAGNYYLAAELNLEECWLQVWGYATHQQLREQGRYDRMDETYVIEAEDLVEDLTALWVAREIYPSRRPEVAPLLTLSSTEASKLLRQLAQQTPYSPRLDAPFAKWAALLAEPRWRQELYEQRLEQVSPDTVSTQTQIYLEQWFQNVFDAGWQSLETLLNQNSVNLAFSFRQSQPTKKEARQISVEGVKLIDLGMELGDQSLALLVGLMVETSKKASVRVQLYPASGQTYLPPKIRLTLLSQSGAKISESIARSQDNLIQLKRFTCPIGKGFSIQVTLDDFSLSENFLIESLTQILP